MASGEPYRRLEPLIGSFSGREHWHPSTVHPNGHTAAARTNTRVALGGYALVQDYEHEEDGVVTYHSHSVLRWDADTEEYVLHAFDASGGPPQEYRGTCHDKQFTLVGDGPAGKARTIMELEEDGYHLRYDVHVDGEWAPFMVVRYKRQDD